MKNIQILQSLLKALPDPAFVLSRSGRYVAVYGGKDTRYYHDGSGLVGLNISDLVVPEKADWFLQQIALALASRQLHIEEYELSNKDVKGLTDEGPDAPIWFEGRIQALDFQVDDEDVVLWVASNISKRHELENTLRALSYKDQLTGLFNRHRLAQDLTSHYENFIRHGYETAIIMFDLDNLKQVNDVFGHHHGDELLQVVAKICQQEIRKSDLVCRYGGDEFVIVLPNISVQDAVNFAERLRSSFYTQLEKYKVNDIWATASMGATSIQSIDQSYEDTLKRVDRALYQAKANGRDQVVLI
ncbi:MAG: diguanylate cyclase [Oceanospirillaceae bacterium]|nr:diguanylate cyclase [Oceanospirillaceae bacterium]